MATEKASKAPAAKPAKTKSAAPAAAKTKAKDVSEKKGPTLTMNGKEYIIADLSASAKESLQAIAFADQEVRRLTMMLGLAKTARVAYRNALVASLPQDAA